MSHEDRLYLDFADRFERRFLNQGRAARAINETMDQAWELLSMLPDTALKRIRAEYIGKYYRRQDGHG